LGDVEASEHFSTENTQLVEYSNLFRQNCPWGRPKQQRRPQGPPLFIEVPESI
jgi:hypothetical protein